MEWSPTVEHSFCLSFFSMTTKYKQSDQQAPISAPTAGEEGGVFNRMPAPTATNNALREAVKVEEDEVSVVAAVDAALASATAPPGAASGEDKKTKREEKNSPISKTKVLHDMQ